MLYVVATPIGNLSDLSARAKALLAQVDIIAAEDTRRTGRLLSYLGIQSRLVPLHDHNERESTARLLSLLGEGRAVALLSDAGTPLVSDPGYLLVKSCLARGIDVAPLPGPSSVTAALSVAGIPAGRYAFEGFLPARSAARRQALEALQHERRTLVLFEAPHRIVACVKDARAILGAERAATLCRELTKAFEQIVAGSLDDLLAALEAEAIPARGEFVLVIAGAAVEAAGADADVLLAALLAELSPSRAASVAARVTGLPKAELYRRAISLKQTD